MESDRRAVLQRRPQRHGSYQRIEQPLWGYIDPDDIIETLLDDGRALGEESIHPTLTGIVVDYLTRWVMGSPLEEAFSISIMGGRRGGKPPK